jgi:outer membrane receptor protein involved in Fe transport
MRFVRPGTPLAVAIAVVLYGGAAVARAEKAEGEPGLQEIVVTATRREMTVLDIPYSIQAVSGADLAKSGVSDITNLVHLAPGLSMFDEGPRVSGNRNSFSIRGLNADNAYNNDDNAALTESPVATYLGETPVFFPFKLVDLDRVEVLRGPQGTLYGESSIGGTVRFIPNAPNPKALTLDVNAKISMTEHADEPSYDGSLTANVPLNDRSALRATVGHEFLSGFINADGLVQQTGTATNPGSIILQNPGDILHSAPAKAPVAKDYNKADLDYFRGSALLGLTDRLTVTLNLAYQETVADGRYEDDPVYGSGRNYQMYKAFTDPQKSSIRLYDIDVNADLGFATLTSSSGASNAYTRSISESSGFERVHLASYYFGYPRLYAPITRTQEFDNYTQELRLVSKDTKTLEWIVGAFYKSSHTTFHLSQPAYGINAYTNAYLGLTPPVNFTDLLAIGYTATTFKDIAGFGELTWHLNDRWQMTAGARVFHDSLGGISGIPLPYASLTSQYFATGVANDPFYLGGYLPVNSKESDHIFKGGTSFKINDSLLAYLTISQGYRPGGANGLPATDPLGNDNRPYLIFKPDTDTNYEIGLKGKIHDRFSYVATAFLVNWQNFQTTLFTPFGINYVANVAPARSEGVELEFKGSLTKALSFGVNYSYTDAYARQAFELQANTPTTTVAAGTPLPGSTKNAFSEYLEFTQPLAASALVFRVDGSYRGPSVSSFDNFPTFSQNNYVRFPAINVWSASVTWDKDPFLIGLYGENLTDDRGTTQATSAALYGADSAGYGVIRPRTFGVRFKWSYK